MTAASLASCQKPGMIAQFARYRHDMEKPDAWDFMHPACSAVSV
jgi:hypothetical protein